MFKKENIIEPKVLPKLALKNISIEDAINKPKRGRKAVI